ncbi:glycerol-3-phosphate dehydrogenase/oxidase [Skermania piniformis]|uniref:glycerol-3-phosphate dehydrogenase/oxidase n=1 Tax=Skermania pinensis TaxID=39122 RepID=UPI000A914487|nr:glycerol-3-phosphate dehydrogenase/oxidase [Skermania piniformis]
MRNDRRDLSPEPSRLNAARRARDLARLGDRAQLDLLVIGGGVTGVGIALDAATRGLRTVLVEGQDLAFGTSRWSSKLAHGGLRYLASGRVGVARESAVERGILMTRTAPHLVRPMPQVVPLLPQVGRRERRLIRTGFAAGDTLRAAVRTPANLLPRSRQADVAETTAMVPGLRTDGLDGSLIAYDGQLIDDARLVVTIARTAAEHGATILTRVRAEQADGTGATLVNTLTGESLRVTARAVVNATGVWADTVDPSIRLRPSRGTHLVFDGAAFGNPIGALTLPVPGEFGRFVFALPQQDGRVYLGITDEDAPGPIPDEPQPTDAEIDFLLDTINLALHGALDREDIRGQFAGLRPLLDTGGSTADISRKHAVLTSDTGLITVVGGKLTTYRKMAQDAVDRAVGANNLDGGPCVTRNLPLLGAPGHPASTGIDGLPHSLVARYGGIAAEVAAAGVEDPLAPVGDGIDISRAEIAYAFTHEGALSASDALDRRTRLGLIAADADRARPVVDEIIVVAH